MSGLYDKDSARPGDLCVFDEGLVGLFYLEGELRLVEVIQGQRKASLRPIPVDDPTLRVMRREQMKRLREVLSLRLHIRFGALSERGQGAVRDWPSDTFYQSSIWPTRPAVDVFGQVAAELEFDETELQIGYYLVFGRFYGPEFLGEDEPAEVAA